VRLFEVLLDLAVEVREVVGHLDQLAHRDLGLGGEQRAGSASVWFSTGHRGYRG